MSAITIEDELVHYEVLGRGKPIILVHGWLGSWRYWVPTMQQLSTKYRCYALDLWGFGDSGKDPARYSLEKQIDLLDKFIERMGIPKVVLVGHSLGAAVVAQFAANAETGPKVHRMLLVAPPLLDHAPEKVGVTALTTNVDGQALKPVELPPPLSDTQAQMPAPSPEDTIQFEVPDLDDDEEGSGAPASENRKTGTSEAVTLHPGNTLKAVFEGQSIEDLLGRATNPENSDFEKLKAEAIKADHRAIDASADAFAEISTFRDLMAVTAPVCTLLGENDGLLPRPDDDLLHQLDARPSVKLLVMGNAQHFPMLDDKAQFVRLLKDFLEAPDVATLEMKEEWRRRKR